MNQALFVIITLCGCLGGNLYADLVHEIREKVQGLAISDSKYRLHVISETSTPSSQQLKTQKIDVLGSILTVEKTYSEISSYETPYIRTVERYLTNGFEIFREGGMLKNGKKIANESELGSTEQPVIGLALFASKCFQARLIGLMNNPSVDEVLGDGGPCYVLSGQVKFQNMPLRVRLLMSKIDYLLLEMETSFVTNSHNKLVATRKETKDDNWPYSRISSEVWSQDQLISKNDMQISANRTLIKEGEDSQEFKIPVGAIVTDKRFGYGVVYYNQKKGLTDEEIAQMSTDPDFRTNKYFLNHFHILSTTSSSALNRPKRFIIIGIILAIGLVPFAVLLLRRSKKRSD